MEQSELIPHLFRNESSKITAVLCKLFGIEYIGIAEDITSETFLKALETWPYRGIPENPVAWLYVVAKNLTKNYLARNKIFSGKVTPVIKQQLVGQEEPEIDLSDQNIRDSQLKMLFAICHPSLSHEAQVGLALRILCGFGTQEIADAFLTNKETINKRLFRAKEWLRHQKVAIDFPGDSEIDNRLDRVLTTIYLLFSEGYYSESNETVLREELCWEAMRLNYLLLENERTNLPVVNALYSLMCFHASRFPARKKTGGEMILYEDQDASLWDYGLISKGAYHLKKASEGDRLSKYHLEAGIAWWHTVKEDTEEKWENILGLYNRLLLVEYSPIAALNRTYALSKVRGAMVAAAEAEKLQLTGNHYYYLLLGELYKGINVEKARQYFQKALRLAKTAPDLQSILKRMDGING